MKAAFKFLNSDFFATPLSVKVLALYFYLLAKIHGLFGNGHKA
jgi:hypothetical protein